MSRSAPLVYFFAPYSWPPKKASGSAGAARARFCHCASPCLPRSNSALVEQLEEGVLVVPRVPCHKQEAPQPQRRYHIPWVGARADHL